MAAGERQLTDTQAIERIHAWMSGHLWDGAADFLEAISEVVAATGRAIEDAPDQIPWNHDSSEECATCASRQ